MYSEIKLVCIDCDGVLTDGVYQISESGEVTKSFYTRDFYGIEQLLREGIRVLILTQSHDLVISKQVKRICDHSNFWKNNKTGSYGIFFKGSSVEEALISGIKEKILCVSSAVKNKKKFVEFYLETTDLSWDNVAYIGDAENDLECIELAGFSGCPNDAIPIVRDKAMYPSDYFGGRGAVYDFCMYIIEQRNKETEDEKT